ncbi:flagellar protein FlgN [Massilia agilis]|uniref:Flagellar protein FlgN n=1 Tax=Massilia agilis TaxID=1811226 RepID=A0ABT2DAE7_9BURK|nr:flagellar protein FlgN [Massilia agilis]MCS0807411.1 flagellar protein FlgN [Massilia agilis]
MTPDSTLAAERQLLASLTELLREEQRLLVAADADALSQVTPRKNQLVQQLAAQAVERHRLLSQAGFEAAEAGMEPWLAAHGTASARAEWEQLLEAAREAKELNRVNGMLINKHMAHNQQVLAELRPQGAHADSTVYGPGGLTFGGGPSKRFVLG